MKINKTVGCNKNNQKSLVSKGNSSRHKYTKTLMGLTCGIIGLGTIATVPLMTTSCSNNNSPTYDYIGNDNMKNWKGFISGNVNDSYFQFDDSDNTCGIKDQSWLNAINFSAKNLIIPNRISHNNKIYKFISIGDYAFYGCRDNFEGNVTIPNTVVIIGASAFSGCTGLTGKLTIPDSVESIGDNAFAKCSNLSGELLIPDSVEIIDSGAFNGCKGFTSLSLGKAVNTIRDGAFTSCTGLTKVLLPKTLKHLGKSVFKYCDGLIDSKETDGKIFKDEGNVYYIQNKDVYFCLGSSQNINDKTEEITNVKFKAGTEIIAAQAFYNCTTIKQVLSLPDSLITIGDEAFSGCSALSGDLTIPNKVETIGNQAFLKCAGLDGVLTIGDGVTVIGFNSFNACKSLTGLKLGSSVVNIGEEAFANCAKMTGTLTIPDSVVQIYYQAFAACKGFTDLKIGNSVKLIDKQAFYDCEGMKSDKLSIPDSVVSIGDNAFSRTTFTSKITINFKKNTETYIGSQPFAAMKIDGIVFTHLTEASNNWEKDWSDKGDKTSYPITWATENNIID